MQHAIYIITGSTASGKSDIAIKLAKKINGVVINADSKQIYKEIPIITAQPSDNEEIPHWLYGHISVKDKYSVAQWLREVNNTIKSAHNKEMTPIITGGTGFYIKALTDGLNYTPQISETTKEKVQNMLHNKTRTELHNFLANQDPQTASRIYPNDSYRLTRALEIMIESDKTVTEWQQEKSKTSVANATFKKYIVTLPREELYRKINLRFAKMVRAGVLEEAKTLLSMNLPQDLPSIKSHGIPELMQYLEGKLTLNIAIKKAQQNTRNYAKRQITWLKNQMFEAQKISCIEDINGL